MSAYGFNIVVSPLSRGTIEITAPPEKFQGDLTVGNAPHLERLVVIDKSGEYRGFRDVRVGRQRAVRNPNAALFAHEATYLTQLEAIRTRAQ
jgi:hypothetical protein